MLDGRYPLLDAFRQARRAWAGKQPIAQPAVVFQSQYGIEECMKVVRTILSSSIFFILNTIVLVAVANLAVLVVTLLVLWLLADTSDSSGDTCTSEPGCCTSVRRKPARCTCGCNACKCLCASMHNQHLTAVNISEHFKSVKYRLQLFCLLAKHLQTY